MKYLVIGSSGQLGAQVVKDLLRIEDPSNILAPCKEEFDLLNKKQIAKVINNFSPDVIIGCGAITDVENAEDEKKELAFLVNVQGYQTIVNCLHNRKTKLIFISTDYVFDGLKDGLYEVNDSKNPLNIYGVTKAMAEDIVLSYERSFVVRTSWIFGSKDRGFVDKMVQLAKDHESVKIVSDQIGSPTYAPHLSLSLLKLALTDKYGIYHITNEGFISRSDLIKEVYRRLNIKTQVVEIKILEAPDKAKRPLKVCLSKQSLLDNGFPVLPSYEEALDEYCQIKRLKKL